MKRILAVLLVMFVCASSFPFAMAEYSRESFYEMGLTALENMDDESAALAVDHFRAANGYMLAPSYLQYAQSLQEILTIDENSDISMAIYRLQRLQEFPQYDEFAASLKEHQFPSCPDLIIYAEGKQLEHDGDYAKARRKYEAVSWVLDAMLRSVELTLKVYEQGKQLLEEKQYEAAAAALEGLNWKDSDKLYQQAYRMVHPNAEVVVRYVAEDGTELSSHVITIMPNHTVTAQAKSFNGYRLVSNSTVTITVDDYGVATPKAVTFTYKAIPLSAEITVSEQTQYGQILNSRTVTIKNGTTESIKANTYPGYNVTGNGSVKVSVNSDGVPSQSSVIFTYKEKPRVQVGEYITFGHYPQTASGTDRTPIEWLVLDVQGHKALVISRYGLDAKPYNEERVAVTWETCTLRAWLNDSFLNTAFSAKEQSAILLTHVDNSYSQGISGWAGGGYNSPDRLFLLSYAEANKYFGVRRKTMNSEELDISISRTTPTPFAIRNGAKASTYYKLRDNAAAVLWWLRSPGYHNKAAAYVYADGSVGFTEVEYRGGVVRPAFWINLDALDN